VALARVAPRRPESRAALRAALADPVPGVRRAAAKALGAIGPDAAGAATELRARLHDDSPLVRAAAEWALKAIVAKPTPSPSTQPGPATRAAQ
jgi:HEAT repeat protein